MSREVGITIGMLTDQLRRDAKDAEGVFGGFRDRVSGAFDQLGKSGIGFGAAVGAGAAAASLAIDGLVTLIGTSADKVLRMSDAFADVQKTSGMTRSEVEGMAAALAGLDTRTSLEGLLDIAKVGGQLGIASSQLADFVEATDKAVVALGDEFTGGVEEVTKVLGGLGKLFADTRTLSAAEQIDRIGSAMNALGAAGSATSPVMGEFAARMGQLGALAPPIADTLALGATLQELGLSAEIASGGLANILLKAGENLPAFAAQVGMTVTEFEKLLNSSPNEVILKLAESFKGLSNTETIQALDGMKVGTQESIKVMSSLSGAVDMVRAKQALSNEEFSKATSLQDEFAIKNNTLAGNLEKIQNGISNMATGLVQSGGALSYFYREFENVVAGVAKWFSVPVSEKLEQERIALRSMQLELASANVSTERRAELIKELQEKYPQYTASLSAEKSSYKDIEAAIEATNDALLSKIVLQRQAEKIQGVLAQKEEALTRQAEAQEALQRRMVQVQEKYASMGLTWKVDPNKTLRENLDGLQKAFNVLFQSNKNWLDIIGDGTSRGALLGQSMISVRDELSEMGAELIRSEGYVKGFDRQLKELQETYTSAKERLKGNLLPDTPGPGPSTDGPVIDLTPRVGTNPKKVETMAAAAAVETARVAVRSWQQTLLKAYSSELTAIDASALPSPMAAFYEQEKRMAAAMYGDMETEEDWVSAWLRSQGFTQEEAQRLGSEVASFAASVQGLAGESIGMLADGIGSMFDSSMLPEDRAKSFFATVGNFVGSALRKLGMMLISAGIAMKGLQKSLVALFANPATAIAAGAVMVATGAAITAVIRAEQKRTAKQAANIPAFYNGGIIKGTPGGILAQVGERNQSEVIMPLSKLDQYLGSGGDVRVYGELRLGHDALKASIERIDRKSRS